MTLEQYQPRKRNPMWAMTHKQMDMGEGFFDEDPFSAPDPFSTPNIMNKRKFNFGGF